jgi:hypothetical protein
MRTIFRRERHRKVQALLAAFDASLLSRCNTLFAGGARIVLALGEYRDSHGVFFRCPDAEGYVELRFAVSSLGHDVLFKPDRSRELRISREIRFNQYGLWFPVEIEGETIRVWMLREASIELDPGVRPEGLPVDCLSLTDCYAEKLMANSDRWADRQVLSRDLIDLSALRRSVGPIPEEAWQKVEEAYGMFGRSNLLKALLAFTGDAAYQQQCFQELHVDEPEEILSSAAQLILDLEAPSGSS